MKCTCKQCGKEFELSPSEISFYKRKKLKLPRRCKECRQKNKDNVDNKDNSVIENKNYSQKKNNNTNFETGSVSENKYTDDNKKGFMKRIVPIVTAVLVVIASIFGINFIGDNNEAADNSAQGSASTYEASVNDSIPENFGRHFKNEELLNDHYIKHGREMGFASAEEYEAKAAEVVRNKKALNKKEKEDGDDVFYIEDTNEFVIVSTEGYIRTYFYPDNGIDYYNRK